MIERLLEPGSTELPDCTCGDQMRLGGTRAATSDTAIKIFCCPTCEREFRLTVWSERMSDIGPGGIMEQVR